MGQGDESVEVELQVAIPVSTVGRAGTVRGDCDRQVSLDHRRINAERLKALRICGEESGGSFVLRHRTCAS
ncbi:MAG: hypothetical protein EA350_14785 [Gemmatimonadales bacterium]|nr:MAG: hypothetical protein EA350_14785 [Gemmatimonadales bacterium]